MTSKTMYHYGMYTDAGNELISDIVATAKRAGLKWRGTAYAECCGTGRVLCRGYRHGSE